MGKIMLNGRNYSGGGSGLNQTLLWSGDLTAKNSPVTLADDITNYSNIRIVYSFHSSNSYYRKACLYPTDYIVIGQESNLQEGLFYEDAHKAFLSVQFVTASTFQIDESYVTGWGAHVLAIYGIN